MSFKKQKIQTLRNSYFDEKVFTAMKSQNFRKISQKNKNIKLWFLTTLRKMFLGTENGKVLANSLRKNKKANFKKREDLIMRIREQYCTKCGHKWQGVHARCPECGNKLTDKEKGEISCGIVKDVGKK